MQKKIKLSEKLMEKHGKIRYRFMNAYLFATVFQKNQETLKDLIAALLRIELKEIVSLEILNPILPGQDIDHKSCIMDILVLLNGNIRVNLGCRFWMREIGMSVECIIWQRICWI